MVIDYVNSIILYCVVFVYTFIQNYSRKKKCYVQNAYMVSMDPTVNRTVLKRTKQNEKHAMKVNITLKMNYILRRM